jgi:ATP-dependent Clp protease ATP-binding subunit ClpX
LFRSKLSCSFCRRSETEVARLVAGPRVYICDRCAAHVMRIMNESPPGSVADPGRPAKPSILDRLRRWWRFERVHQAIPHRLG